MVESAQENLVLRKICTMEEKEKIRGIMKMYKTHDKISDYYDIESVRIFCK